EIIRETNAVVAEDDIEACTMLDNRVGEKYFYKCIELAENVIKSFEDEQPKLNENQQIVFDWLKVAATDNYKNPVLEGLFAVAGMVNDLHPHFDTEICKAYETLILEQESQVLEVFAKWALEQEDHR
uniref:hypothetical protein n=1 Tax=Escherichia coli TaxID=562 RepID=UPI000CD7FA29